MPTTTHGPFLVCDAVVNTGVHVASGDRIGIVAQGEVDFGGGVFGMGAPILDADGDNWATPSDYPAPELRKNSLICSVGPISTGRRFQGGVRTSFVADADGVLRLAPNDKNVSDNSRSWSVTVYHSSPETVGEPVPRPLLGSWQFFTRDGGGGILGPSCGRVPSAVLFQNRHHVFYKEESGGGNVKHLDFASDLQDFRIEVLDGDGGPNGRTSHPVGSGGQVAIVHGGQIHVFYSDTSIESFGLRHAVFDGSTWQFEVLDGRGGANGRVDGIVAGYVQISAVSVADVLHLFYIGWTDRSFGPGGDGLGSRTGVLRHAFLPNNGVWYFEDLDGAVGQSVETAGTRARVGESTAAVADRWDQVHVFYTQGLDAEEGRVTNLRHAWHVPGMGWHFETMDGRGGSSGRIRARVGTFPVAVLFRGKIHVCYYDTTYENLRHAVLDGSEWTFETLDGTGGSNGRTKANVGGTTMAAAVLPDQLSFFYWDATNANLRHAFWKGVNWQFEVMDGEGGSNGRISAAVGWQTAALVLRYETPQSPPAPPVVTYLLSVFYHNASDTSLRHALAFMS